MPDVVGACSLDCPDACSWVVSLDASGTPTRLRGNPDHPFTRGGLCAKVNPYLHHARRPDRLLHPLRRVGPKGAGDFVRVTWDDALGEIAARLRGVLATHGGEAIWPYAGTGTVGVLQGYAGAGRRLFHALGASRHDPNICSRAGHAGMAYSCGSAMGMDPEDLAHSRLILLWGTNTLTTNLHLWPFVTAGRAAGARVVVIDPVRTRTAAQADVHIAPRPGTDAALALGVMARLVTLGACDEAYLREWSLGWQEFRDDVLAGWSPRRAGEICGLAEEQVEGLAEMVAQSRPTGIRCLMGMQRHRGGGQAARVLACLPALTGDFARRGGGICYSTGPAYPINEGALARPDLEPDGPTRSLAMTRIADVLLEVRDPPVQALVMWAANPVVSNPDQSRVREALSREDLFTVCIDHVPTDTTAYADIVLPGTTQIEHVELQDSYTHVYLGWNAAAVAPPGECLPHTEIFRRLASALGLEEPALYDSDEDLARAALSGSHPALAGITLERLQERGWVRLGYPTPYLPFAEGFPTPSGLFEFSSERALVDGHGRFPGYTPPYEAAASSATADVGVGVEAEVEVGVALVSAANHYLLNSTFSGSPHHTRAGEPTVTVHPDDARAFDLVDGERARVANGRGEFVARVRVSTDVRPGVAATTKGHAPAQVGGPTVNVTVAERDADMGRGATFHDNRVRLSPVRSARGERR